MKKALALILAAVLLLSLLTACGSKSEDTTGTAPAPASEVTPADATEATKPDEIPSFVDGVVKTEDYTMTIKEAKVVAKGESGNTFSNGPVIAFFYDITNNSDEELMPEAPWTFDLRVIQDNDPNTVNKLSSAMWDDSTLNDNMIKPGGTSSYVQAYELTDETTPVTVEATILQGDVFGTQTFDIAK